MVVGAWGLNSPSFHFLAEQGADREQEAEVGLSTNLSDPSITWGRKCSTNLKSSTSSWGPSVHTRSLWWISHIRTSAGR